MDDRLRLGSTESLLELYQMLRSLDLLFWVKYDFGLGILRKPPRHVNDCAWTILGFITANRCPMCGT